MPRTRTTDDMFDRAARFLWLTGRVLEQRRFAALFAGHSPHGVRQALAAYRTPDGGYAYGLEPDIRGPEPQPATLRAALPVLDEAGALDRATTAPLLDWLRTVTAPDGGLPVTLPTLRPYPRPPWLLVPDGHTEPTGELLATGPVVATLLKNDVTHPWVERAIAFCRDAVTRLETTHPYEAEAAVAFLDHAPDRDWAADAARRLGRLVREQRLVLLDPRRADEVPVAPGYAPGEHHFPHDYAPTPHSLARQWFDDTELNRSLDHLAALQRPDGGWPVRWAHWAPTTESESRPLVTLQALRILTAWDTAAGILRTP
ncbi:hypothetical protein ACFWHW_32435 [Streptomyces pharetrae]|uniref:hypothetical protein n=1 Tax=Streptomyces pharetrae TaxID=291370 RepID=UPI00365DCD5F